jgi:ATP-dependent Clp protease ATP-binding subunit ClpA
MTSTSRRSQYHDRYTIARLLGAAPGLIGYDEGGMLLLASLYNIFNSVCLVRSTDGSCSTTPVWCE